MKRRTKERTLLARDRATPVGIETVIGDTNFVGSLKSRSGAEGEGARMGHGEGAGGEGEEEGKKEEEEEEEYKKLVVVIVVMRMKGTRKKRNRLWR